MKTAILFFLFFQSFIGITVGQVDTTDIGGMRIKVIPINEYSISYSNISLYYGNKYFYNSLDNQLYNTNVSSSLYTISLGAVGVIMVGRLPAYPGYFIYSVWAET